MAKLTKNQKLALEKMEVGKAYSLREASELVKEITFTKFDASVDIDVRLGVDPRKANQMVRGVVSLPHGTGKQVRVLVLCTPDKEAEAKEAGADHVGLDDYIEKIKAGWTDVDVIITMPSTMGKIGALGRILGPRGLMPNPKSGTVTMEVGNAVREVKQGKIDFKVDKNGIVHAAIGKVSFTPDQIRENAKEFILTLIKLKPTAAKGTYLKSIYLSSTMSKGIKVDPKSIEETGKFHTYDSSSNNYQFGGLLF
jgi:large subunit ribosomal protein L1